MGTQCADECHVSWAIFYLFYSTHFNFFKFEYFHLVRQKKKQKKLNAKRKREEGKKEEGGKFLGFIKGNRAPAMLEHI